MFYKFKKNKTLTLTNGRFLQLYSFNILKYTECTKKIRGVLTSVVRSPAVMRSQAALEDRWAVTGFKCSRCGRE